MYNDHITTIKAVAILGCGWLGLPLAVGLIAKGIRIKGSVTSADKAALLRAEGIEPYVIRFDNSGVTGDISNFLDDCETLIITTPPGKTEGPFGDAVDALSPHIERSGIRNVIMISSISVYGNNKGRVTWETLPLPDTETARQLLKAEQTLMAAVAFKGTVIRFGGLTGGERHPVKHLAGRQALPDGDAPINLIHLKDCIGIIERVLESGAGGLILNAVWPGHPSRSTYYTQKAREYNLEPPTFCPGGTDGKIICSDYLTRLLNYTFTAMP